MTDKPLLTGISKHGTEIRILPANRLYILLYQGRPFIQKNARKAVGVRPDYRRNSYPTKRPAVARAAELNKLFDTDEFTVSQIVLD